MTDLEPAMRAALNLQLMADEYDPGHPDGQALRDIAHRQDARSKDHASRESARRRGLAGLGTPAPLPLNPLPEPGDLLYGADAKRLPPGSVVYRDDVAHRFGRRECVAPDRWTSDLADDIGYRVSVIPAQS